MTCADVGQRGADWDVRRDPTIDLKHFFSPVLQVFQILSTTLFPILVLFCFPFFLYIFPILCFQIHSANSDIPYLGHTTSIYPSSRTKHQAITMTTFNGKCHCGQTEWTVTLPQDSQAHILWQIPVRASLTDQFANRVVVIVMPARSLVEAKTPSTRLSTRAMSRSPRGPPRPIPTRVIPVSGFCSSCPCYLPPNRSSYQRHMWTLAPLLYSFYFLAPPLLLFLPNPAIYSSIPPPIIPTHN